MFISKVEPLIRTGEEFRAFLKEHDIDDRLLSSALKLPEERIANIRAGKWWTTTIPGKYAVAINALVRKYHTSAQTKCAPQVEPTEKSQPLEPKSPAPSVSEPTTDPRPESAPARILRQSAHPQRLDDTQEAATSSEHDGETGFASADQQEPSGELVGETPITFSVVTKAEGSLSKHLDMDASGRLNKDSSNCWIANGTIESYEVPMSKLAPGLKDLNERQALVLTNRSFAPNTPLVSTKQRQEGAVTRTRNEMQYVPGQPALLLFDADPSANYTASSVEAFIKDCASFIPGLEDCGYVATHSTSSFVSKSDGTPLTQGGGFHIFFAIKDAGPLRDPKALKQLKDRILARAWGAGMGQLFIDKAGKMHTRCITDVSVFQPERISFEANPTLGEALVQHRPPPVHKDGTYLDLDALREPLSWDKQQHFNELVAEKKREAEPEAKQKKEVYVANEVKKLMASGLNEADAREQLHARIDNGVIKGNEILHLQNNGEDRPAWQVLADIEHFDGAYLADPVEPDYGAAPGGICRTKAQIHNDGPRGVNIWSFAHGGRQFRIEHTEATLREHLALLSQSRPDEFKSRWAALVADTPLTDTAHDALCHWLKKLEPLNGARVSTIRKELEAAIDQRPKHSVVDQTALDLGDKERDPADIRNEYAEQCQHLIDDPDVLGTLVRRLQTMGGGW